MTDQQIIEFLLELLEDNRFFNGPHHNMLNEISEKYNISPTRLLELYRQAQELWKQKHHP